ncbi:fimbria/pilus outer membrane usher protein [Luteimonas sp. S4-F44]|uniref:fimbria/pilus outer membrane usher protein n=1 Tax=Luteimonas sp. S4-F44 TaxID=2925842 RepID=UPI001F538078|nr:fimbria/pilus outer membrane usher protein [Luteimonas sp. S4-F44]UNK41424.1 fimbria/pilus outer membrane usher protein [Luteimonas sp. S4-F44]
MPRPSTACLASALLCAGLAPAPPTEAAAPPGRLPPPPRASDAVGEGLVHLELVVNGLASGRVVPVELRDGHYLVDAAVLHALHVRVDAPDEDGRVAVDRVPGVTVDYDVVNLRLHIQVPADWLPTQHFDSHAGLARHPSRASSGMLLNYDLYATRAPHASTATSLWTDVRLFGDAGTVSSSGAWRHGGGVDRAFVRYDTRWQRVDEAQARFWEAGDLITRGPVWTSPVRIGGVQFSRDFSLRPDIVTYPLPQFAGQAGVPSAVDLYVNGNLAARERVDPGPFALTDVPFINGAGEAVVVVTDALGRQVATAVPFYVSSRLLAPGLSDFALAAGALRRDYGVENFAYGPVVASAAYSRGLTDALTVETLGEAAEDLTRLGAGGVVRLGMLGVLNAAYSRSESRGRSGDQIDVGYQYARRGFTLSAQHQRSDRDFVDLARYDPRTTPLFRPRTTVVAGSVALGRWGSLGLGHIALENADASRIRLVNLSWSVSPWQNIGVYLSGNRDIDSGDWSAVAQLVVSLRHGNVTATHDRASGRGDAQRLRYTRPVPSDGGLGLGLGYSRFEAGDDQLELDALWRNRHVQFGGGVRGSAGAHTLWASAAGAIVRMGGGTFLSNRISDAFVVVDTNGFADIPVRYENVTVGTTDRSGRLLVPWSGAHYAAKFEIDPLQLPTNVQTPVVEQRVAVRRGSGYVMHFPVERTLAALVTLHDAAGVELAPGTPVTSAQGEEAYVGWDGLVYLSRLAPDNTLTARPAGGASCTVRFTLAPDVDGLARIGPLACR